jgi:hypothetical protein
VRSSGSRQSIAHAAPGFAYTAYIQTSRRTFALAAAAAQEKPALTAAAVIERIRANVGVPWRDQTVDTIKSGNPATPVKGIATTMMATLGPERSRVSVVA